MSLYNFNILLCTVYDKVHALQALAHCGECEEECIIGRPREGRSRNAKRHMRAANGTMYFGKRLARTLGGCERMWHVSMCVWVCTVHSPPFPSPPLPPLPLPSQPAWMQLTYTLHPDPIPSTLALPTRRSFGSRLSRTPSLLTSSRRESYLLLIHSPRTAVSNASHLALTFTCTTSLVTQPHSNPRLVHMLLPL